MVKKKRKKKKFSSSHKKNVFSVFFIFLNLLFFFFIFFLNFFTDSKNELKILNKSLIFKFLELIDVLITKPSEHQSKITDIQNIFINMYYLLNTHRSNQARSFIIEYLKSQIEEKKIQMEKLDK